MSALTMSVLGALVILVVLSRSHVAPAVELSTDALARQREQPATPPATSVTR